jgi:hypothetical protein
MVCKQCRKQPQRKAQAAAGPLLQDVLHCQQQHSTVASLKLILVQVRTVSAHPGRDVSCHVSSLSAWQVCIQCMISNQCCCHADKYNTEDGTTTSGDLFSP